jgi:hypothetical protein
LVIVTEVRVPWATLSVTGLVGFIPLRSVAAVVIVAAGAEELLEGVVAPEAPLDEVEGGASEPALLGE